MSDLSTNKPIDNLGEYCKDFKKPCVPKCCGLDEVLFRKSRNMTRPICTSASSLGIDVGNYKEIEIYNTTVENNVLKVKKNFLSDFHVIRNRWVDNETCADRSLPFPSYLLENGWFASDMRSLQSSWVVRDPEHFCVDLTYIKSKNITRLTYFVAKEKGRDSGRELTFVGVATLISSIFLILVFLVYCMLPQLQNLSGMLLMAYVITLFLASILKAINIFFSSKMKHVTCGIITATFYFAYLSVFVWLNIMSFDIWWTFRGQRLKRAINRKGEVIKFAWYSLYGWGAPLAVSIVAVIIDNERDKLPYNIVKPMFDTGLNSDSSILYYMHVPSGLLTVVNIALFIMTIYNILLIKRKLEGFNNSSSTKKNKNRFGLYVKLSMLMGTSWLLELVAGIYGDIPFSVYILLNLYNAVIGVIIFIMFVLNTKTLRLLCKRYDIQCRFIEVKKFGRNTSRSTTNTGSYHRPGTEDSYLEMYDTEVNTNPNPK